MELPLVSLQNISKKFGKKKVLDSLSLELYPGQILGLVGRSGCGKSTLIKILVGYHHPDSGKVFFNNRDITNNFNEVKEMVGYTTQENSFYEKLTVYENMRYYANLYNVSQEEMDARINYLLKAVNLIGSKDVLAENISGGMKRRLDFAISLLHKPQLIILDEPTAGLDPVLVENFWEIVNTIAKNQKIAVLVSSHILSEIQTYCDSVAFMAAGQISSVMRMTKSMDIESKFKRLT